MFHERMDMFELKAEPLGSQPMHPEHSLPCCKVQSRCIALGLAKYIRLAAVANAKPRHYFFPLHARRTLIQPMAKDVILSTETVLLTPILV